MASITRRIGFLVAPISLLEKASRFYDAVALLNIRLNLEIFTKAKKQFIEGPSDSSYAALFGDPRGEYYASVKVHILPNYQ
jgi:hypothetical protein